MTDSRGKNTQLPMADLLRQSVYSRLAGYEDVNDAERLAQDPTFRLMGSERICERGAALTSRVQSFETERVLGPATENTYALESPKGYIVLDRWKLKRKFRFMGSLGRAGNTIRETGRRFVMVMALASALAISSGYAQTFKILHTFQNGADGGYPALPAWSDTCLVHLARAPSHFSAKEEQDDRGHVSQFEE